MEGKKRSRVRRWCHIPNHCVISIYHLLGGVAQLVYLICNLFYDLFCTGLPVFFFLFSVFSKTKLMFALISIIFSFLPHLFLLISATWLLVLALTSYFPYLCHGILNHRLSELEGNRPTLPPRFTKKPRGEGHVPEILQLVREHPHSRFRLLPLLTTLLHLSLSLLPCSSFP